MKKKAPELSLRYLEALRAHLGTRRTQGMAVARGLGREVVTRGFNALDLARMHEQSLAALALSHDFANARNGLIRKAGKFLTAALAPVEKFHRATRASFEQLQQRAATLRMHRASLAAGNRKLKIEIRRRQAGETAVKRAKEHYEQLFRQSQVMQKSLRRLARQILNAQEEERRAISRDLHDDVMQLLVAINLDLVTMSRAPAVSLRTLRTRLASARRLVEKTTHVVHQFARELRPAVLDDLGLIPALQTYLEAVAARKKLQINLTTFAAVETLDNARRTVLYRVAQEALTNVARHAEATVVSLTISTAAKMVRMEIVDNGRSFAVLKTLSSRTNKRLGLLGMRERVEMVGGTLTIESAEGRGTTVRAELPFTQEGVT